MTTFTWPQITGPAGPTGPTGPAGPGVATGGTTGQVLAKNSNTNFDTHWVAAGGGMAIGGAVTGSTAYANLFVDAGGTLANGFMLFDNAGQNSIQLTDRFLYGNDSVTQMMDYSTPVAGCVFPQGIGDGSPVVSMYPSIRQLISGDNSTAANWSGSSSIYGIAFPNGVGSGTNGVKFLDTENGVIYHAFTGAEAIQIGYPNSDIVFFLSIQDNFTGNISMDTNSRVLVNESGGAVFEWSTGYRGWPYFDGDFGVAGDMHMFGTPGTNGIWFPDGTLQTTAAGGGLWTYDGGANAITPAGPRNLEMYSGYSIVDSTGATSVDSNSRYLRDESNNIAMNWSNSGGRLLYNTSGFIVTDWNNQKLSNTTVAGGQASLDWYNYYLLADGGTHPSIDWFNRKAYRNNAGTDDATINWDRGVLLYNGVATVDWNAKQLTQPASVQVTLDWDLCKLYSTTGFSNFLSLDWQARQAKTSGGTTVLDWSTQQSTTGTTTGFTAGSGTTAKSDSTFTGNSGTKAYTVGDIVKALKAYGLLAAS